MVGDMVKGNVEIWICKDVAHNFSWITIQELVLFIHPARWDRIFGLMALILSSPRLLWHGSKFDAVNLDMEVVMVRYWWNVTMGGKSCGPEAEEVINMRL